MRIIDITVPLRRRMPLWPGSHGCVVRRVLDQECGDEVTGSTIEMDLHCGTHLDAPLHFSLEGVAIDQTDLDACLGSVFVADLRGIRKIGPEHLDERVPDGVTRLLLKTDNSTRWKSEVFYEDFSALTACGAQWVVDRGIRLVGNDYMSIQLFRGDNRTHTRLLEAGVVVVEGVDLTYVEAGEYELICLPICIENAEAAPARAVLIARDSS